MEYIKKDLGSYNLHVIRTDKFKTVMVRVVFQRPVVKDEITMRNVLSQMLLQSTYKYKTKRDMNIKAEDLYAADIYSTNNRLGKYATSNFYLSMLNDKYTEKGNLEKGIEYLSEIIFNPDVHSNKFSKDKLDVVMSSCRSSLNSLKEEASKYSVMRMYEELDGKSPASYRMCGYLEDLDNINEENLYTYYESMIKSDLVDIFVIGDVSYDEMIEVFKKYFKFRVLKKRKTSYLLDDVSAKKKKIVKEEIDNSQSNLSIGCRVHGLSDYERNYPLTLFNVIFGGGCDSKLFKEVREENSLCYTIVSVPNKLDNLLLIRAGIDRYNFNKTMEIIEKDLKDMQKGKFKDSDISVAKELFNTAIDETLESQSRIIDNYLMMEFIGTDDLDKKRELMNKVTKKEIVNVAKKVKIDTVFLLEGGK